jgi:thiol-disulfide isomerase/thioredoxin
LNIIPQIMKYLPNLSTLVLIAVFSCGPQQNQDSSQEINSTTELESTSGSSFVSNPQAVPEQEITTLAIGAHAPDFNLPGTDRKFYQLSDFDDSKVLVIIFTCNHCPTAQAYEDRIIAINEDYVDSSVQIVAISPNSTRGLLLEELGYTDVSDDFEDMILRAEDKGFEFPYLYDGDTHEFSMQYGPTATPHAFVFDSLRMLTYVGRIDGSEKPGTANAEDLRNAIDATLVRKEPPIIQTKTFGCSIKWAWKDEYAQKINEEWNSKEVTLEEIDEEGIGDLLRNDSDKLRLINLWATWCGPCIIEYPEFVDIQRMYGARDFEFISLSADSPDQFDDALKFLTEKSSALKNYIFNSEDKYALIEAIDPEWDGALPFTVLIEPGGNVVYKQMGTIDPIELKKIIVEHEMIGRYY